MSRQIFGMAAAVTALTLAPQARTAELPLPKDGWVSWQVEAVEGAPAFCCWSSWDRRVADTRTCDLDGDSPGYGSRDEAKTDSVRVYARFAKGQLERLRTLASACLVTAKTPIQPIDGIATDDSTRWLAGLRKQGSFGEDALASLAVHRGDVAFGTMQRIARDDADADTRKRAIFWLALLCGTPGAELAKTALYNDSDPDVREHAVFALSLQPDELAAKALIAAAEDRALPRELRKRALFWLAQSESPVATAYLEKVLLGAHR